MYKAVHNFRRQLEQKTMVPIFGPSAERWRMRKKELIQKLRDGGYTSFGQSFYSHVKFGDVRSKSYSEKAFYEGVHVLDHPGHDDPVETERKEDFSKHKKRETKVVKHMKVKHREKRRKSHSHHRRSSRSDRSKGASGALEEEEEEEEGGGGEEKGAETKRERGAEDKELEDGSFKNRPISFVASPGGDGVGRDLPGAPPQDPASPAGFTSNDAGKMVSRGETCGV